MMKKLLLGSLVLVLFFGLVAARAEEEPFADTKTGKAASLFLDGMKQFFEDSKELQGKTNDEKGAYILDKGGLRILAKTAEIAMVRSPKNMPI